MARTISIAEAEYEKMGPSLLARTPPALKREPKAEETPDWTQIFNHLESDFAALRQWRWSWWTHWARLAEFFNPRRYLWLIVANKMWKGAPLNDSIIDSTGLLAVRTCAAGKWTGLTNPSRPWMKLDKGLPWIELDAEAQEWLEDTTERILTVLEGSNFYAKMAQAFQDETVFGTAPILIYEDPEDIIRVYLPAAGEFYLATGARFSVDNFAREFALTVRQIVEKFKLPNCPPDIRTLWREAGQAHNVEFVVCHKIEPNFPLARKGGGEEIWVVPREFTFREVYWLKGKKASKPLSARGFRERPFMVLRSSVVANDAYGRSLCMDALGDNKQVQRETLRKAEFIEKGVRPPMGADPALKMEPSSVMPGQTTYISTEGGKKGFWPLWEQNPAWLPALTQDIGLVNQRIEKCLFVELFMAITRMQGVQPRNELELTKRDLERLQELGPFTHLFETEVASPSIRRVLAIMQRGGLTKPMPASLKSVPLKIAYTSILRMAQQSMEVVAMKDTLATAGGLSSAAKAAGVPDPIRTIDLDKALRKIAERNNFPSDCFFTEEQVQEHDAARERGKEQAQAPQNAMAAVTAAKTLATTPIGGGNALGALTGAGQ